MEICRFPVVHKPLEHAPLPPPTRKRSRSRIFVASYDGAQEPTAEEQAAPQTKKAESAAQTALKQKSSGESAAATTTTMTTAIPKSLRNIKMKAEAAATSPTPILPSPGYVSLPLPSIAPLPNPQTRPFGATSTSSAASSFAASTTTSASIPTLALGPNAVPPLVPSAPLPQHHSTPKISPAPAHPITRFPTDDAKRTPRSPASGSPCNATSSVAAASACNEARSKRKRKTPEQLAMLEKEFESNPMPNKDVREYLSQHLGLTSRQVQIWFQNKRAKVKNRSNPINGTHSPTDESSPEGSPSPAGSLSPLRHSLSTSMLPPSPSFHQFITIDGFFEPSYFDLLLDTSLINAGPSAFLQQHPQSHQQQTA